MGGHQEHNDLIVSLLHTGWWREALSQVYLGEEDVQPAHKGAALLLNHRGNEAAAYLKGNQAFNESLWCYEHMRQDEIQQTIKRARPLTQQGGKDSLIGTVMLALAFHKQGEDQLTEDLLKNTRTQVNTPLEHTLYHITGWMSSRQCGNKKNAESHLSLLTHHLEYTDYGPEIGMSHELALLRDTDGVKTTEIIHSIEMMMHDQLHLPMFLHGHWITEYLGKHLGHHDMRELLPHLNGFDHNTINFRIHTGIALIQSGLIAEGQQLLKESTAQAHQEKLAVKERLKFHLAAADLLQHPQDIRRMHNMRNMIEQNARHYPKDHLQDDLKNLSLQIDSRYHEHVFPRQVRLHLPHSVMQRLTLRVIGKEEIYLGEQRLDFGSRQNTIVRLLTLLKLTQGSHVLRTNEIAYEVFGQHPDKCGTAQAKQMKAEINSAIHDIRKAIHPDLIISQGSGGGAGYSYHLNESSTQVDLDILNVEILMTNNQLLKAARLLQQHVFPADDIGPILLNKRDQIYAALLAHCTSSPIAPEHQYTLQMAIAPFTNMVWQDELKQLLNSALRRLTGKK